MFRDYTGLVPSLGDAPRGYLILALDLYNNRSALSLADTNASQLSFLWLPLLSWFSQGYRWKFCG
jgi:hypothetical protein